MKKDDAVNENAHEASKESSFASPSGATGKNKITPVNVSRRSDTTRDQSLEYRMQEVYGELRRIGRLREVPRGTRQTMLREQVDKIYKLESAALESKVRMGTVLAKAQYEEFAVRLQERYVEMLKSLNARVETGQLDFILEFSQQLKDRLDRLEDLKGQGRLLPGTYDTIFKQINQSWGRVSGRLERIIDILMSKADIPDTCDDAVG